jgi:hypothetical protein
LGKVNLRARLHGNVHIQHLGRNVGQWQIRDHDIRRVHISLAAAQQHGTTGPGNIVVGDHDRFRRPCGTRCVDQSTGFPWFPGLRAFLQQGRILSLAIAAQFQKALPRVARHRALRGHIVRQRVRAIHDQGFQIRQARRNAIILLQLLATFYDHNFGLRMRANVLAGFRIVGGVNAGGDAAGGHGAEIGKEPFGGVEAQDIDDIELLTAEGNQGNTKGIDLLSIFFPGPCFPGRFTDRFTLRYRSKDDWKCTIVSKMYTSKPNK